MRSIETQKSLVNNKTVTNKIWKLTGNVFCPVFTNTMPEMERTKIKYCQSSKFHWHILKTNEIMNVRDFR